MTTSSTETHSTPKVAVNDIGSRKISSRQSTRPSSTSTTATSSKEPVVKVDRDEVLLDIGYKTEGVIPPANSRSSTTSIRMTSSRRASTSRPWSCRRRTGGRLILSKKRAAVRAPWARSRRSRTRMAWSPAR